MALESTWRDGFAARRIVKADLWRGDLVTRFTLMPIAASKGFQSFSDWFGIAGRAVY